MNDTISLQELVAHNNTPKANAMVIKYGYSPAKNYQDLTYKLLEITNRYKEEALRELANIHPHKDLISNYNVIEEVKSSFIGSDSHGAGCICPNCRKYSNFDMEEYLDFMGTKSSGESQNKQINEYIPLIAIAGLFSLAIIAVGGRKA